MAAARAALLRRPGLAAAAANPVLFSGHGLRYRKLEVILTTTIDKLGKAGETVKVAPGHFRNYLMPKMLAVPNIDKFAILMREQSKLYKREEEVVVKEVSKEEDDCQDQSTLQLTEEMYTNTEDWLCSDEELSELWMDAPDEFC